MALEWPQRGTLSSTAAERIRVAVRSGSVAAGTRAERGASDTRRPALPFARRSAAAPDGDARLRRRPSLKFYCV